MLNITDVKLFDYIQKYEEYFTFKDTIKELKEKKIDSDDIIEGIDVDDIYDSDNGDIENDQFLLYQDN